MQSTFEPPFLPSTIPMISLVFIIVLTFSTTRLSDAFFTTPEKKFRSSVKIFSLDHVRAAKFGCGIPSVKSGDCLLFDPEEQGKLQGTGSLADRINHGPSFTLKQKQTYGYMEVNEGGLPIVTNTLPPGTKPHEAQHWLEYLDSKDSFPLNFAKPSSPKVATILARTPLIPGGGIHHVVLQLPEGMHYVEGQSLSIIPPGNDVKGKKYSPRLYSIASTRYGDALDGKTASLCVRRAEFYDKETGVVNPMKKGICSNYLCDSDPGTQVLVAGPVGKTMRLPKNPNTDVIMVATGTGIAPFRGFMHRLFVEETVAKHMFSGTAWLILGVPFSSGLLYKSEFDSMLANCKFNNTN